MDHYILVVGLINYLFLFMKKNKQNQASRGFTLLEILVVMVILGALVAIGLRSFVPSQMKSRDARRKSDLQQVTRALELYYTDKGHYPVNDADGQIVAYGEEGAVTFAWGEMFTDPDQEATVYMSNLPRDPSGLQYFYQAYVWGGSGWDEIDIETDTQAKAYRMFAYLENEQDQSRVGGLTQSCGDELLCNYVTASTNYIETD
jgi:general secretion pathway protein G